MSDFVEVSDLTPPVLIAWLRDKHRRHGEEEDGAAADLIEKLLHEKAQRARTCLYCGRPDPAHGSYCSDAHRAAYYREHMPRGVARTVRRLARGRASIVVHFEEREAERALRLLVGEVVYLGQDPRDG